ncbi:MAG: hypothetical protein IPP22_15465 [Nitrosomonas sp.]|nr:hypothetical protein [Nitrosomonas sp.]
MKRLYSTSSYLPDVESIERMANEIFSALPGAVTVANAPSPAVAPRAFGHPVTI